MSLWVEFITASGYLSSRKIRARFQSLMMGAIEKSRYRSGRFTKNQFLIGQQAMMRPLVGINLKTAISGYYVDFNE